VPANERRLTHIMAIKRWLLLWLRQPIKAANHYATPPNVSGEDTWCHTSNERILCAATLSTCLWYSIWWDDYCLHLALDFAFRALTLLVGCEDEHPACKNCVMRCWYGCLSGAWYGLFAYGPADATAIPKPHHLLLHLNPDWFYFSGTGLPRLSWKRGR